MLVPRQEYSRELKMAAMRGIGRRPQPRCRDDAELTAPLS
jgi:hypothetical protein